MNDIDYVRWSANYWATYARKNGQYIRPGEHQKLQESRMASYEGADLVQQRNRESIQREKARVNA
jgi:hypothetical protein